MCLSLMLSDWMVKILSLGWKLMIYDWSCRVVSIVVKDKFVLVIYRFNWNL